MEIVVATRNQKKIEEIGRILDASDVTLLGLEDFPACPEVQETGSTFEENAVLKAKAVSGHTGRPALADDSGLEVYALGGAPGIYSARFAGEGAADSGNAEKLLREMQSVPDAQRGARFVCVMALAYPDGHISIFTGTVEGSIGIAPKGKAGFGYDPVFYPRGHERTFAEMSPSEKDSLSHRARALERLKEYLINKKGGQ